MNTEELGLRELKKQMTSESIADAALQLTLENGLANVTIEEIARVAFVSPRTVSNYFSCKEEAIVMAGSSDSGKILEGLARRPTDEPPLESLCHVFSEFLDSLSAAQLRLNVRKIKLVDENPPLRPYHAARQAELEKMLRVEIAERTGTDVESDVYPWLVAASAVSATDTAMRLWGKSKAPVKHLPELVQEAFNLISDGLPRPQ